MFQPNSNPLPGVPITVIKTIGLCKSYYDVLAVADLSLEIQAGEIFGFLGPNGAGKSTSINMICGLLAPTRGEVLFFGKPIAAAPEYKKKIGICPQSIILWNKLTCLEQLQFIGELYDLSRSTVLKRAKLLLEQVGLQEQSHRVVSRLSGGMQRRLNLIMALVHDPEIVVLDEPEAGLDPQSRIMVREFIKSMARHKTVILTTHNMDEADRVADRVAIIDHGRLLRVDTPQALKNSIGQGDILEIELENFSQPAADQVLALFSASALRVKTMGASLFLQAQRIMDHLPRVSAILQQAGLIAKEMRLRPNTLEDVFIHLTGRSLRS